MNPLSFAIAYVHWHYCNAFIFILEIWSGAQKATLKLFSFNDLVRSLFSPLMRIQEQHEGKFDMEEYAEIAASNIIMRLVGACIRLILLLVGFVAWVVVFVTGIIFYAIWITLPLIAVGSIIYGVMYFI